MWGLRRDPRAIMRMLYIVLGILTHVLVSIISPHISTIGWHVLHHAIIYIIYHEPLNIRDGNKEINNKYQHQTDFYKYLIPNHFLHFWTKKWQLPLIYTLSGAFVHFILFSLFYLYWEICCIKVSITLYRLNLFNNLFTCEDQVVFTLHLFLLQQNTNVGFWKSIKCFSQFIFYVISLICKSHCAVPTIISRPYFQEQILQSLPRVGSWKPGGGS